MTYLTAILSNADTLIGILSILGTILSALAATGLGKTAVAWYQEHINAKARAIIEAAVVKTYQDLVRGFKATASGAPIGQMTDAQEKIAFDYAVKLVEENGKQAGIDIAKALGPEAIGAVIEMTVSKLKPKTDQLPESVTALFPDELKKGSGNV